MKCTFKKQQNYLIVEEWSLGFFRLVDEHAEIGDYVVHDPLSIGPDSSDDYYFMTPDRFHELYLADEEISDITPPKESADPFFQYTTDAPLCPVCPVCKYKDVCRNEDICNYTGSPLHNPDGTTNF